MILKQLHKTKRLRTVQLDGQPFPRFADLVELPNRIRKVPIRQYPIVLTE
jgi:hypothetical protein